MMKFRLEDITNSLVFGGGHGIGLALVKQLLKETKCFLFVTYRKMESASELLELQRSFPDRIESFQIDFQSEDNLIQLRELLVERGINIDLILYSIGFLHDELIQPEKSFRDFDMETFSKSMNINSAYFGLVAKYFSTLLPKDSASSVVALSAKLGSITDNGLGGWHSYRASKAALNMLIKNLDIELKRKKLASLVLAVHPGTTKTELSRPFTKNTSYILHTPDETAVNILKLIDNVDVNESGKFLSWDGEELKW